MKKLILLLSLSISITFGQQVTGYYPTWWYGSVKATDFDISSLNNIILFSAQDAMSYSPYFTPGDSIAMTADNGATMKALISGAHAVGTKVLISVIGGYGQGNMPIVAADAVKCSTFVANACDCAKARGLDGIELDWEFPRTADSKGWNQLIRMFRQVLDTWTPKGIMMTSVNYVSPNSPPYYKDSMMVFDQILHMSYTMWLGATQVSPYKSGFDTPVKVPTQFSGYTGTSLPMSGLKDWITAGYPKSKMSVGISFESSIFSGVTTMGQSYSSYQFGSSATQCFSSSYPSIPTTGRNYDTTAQSAYCINGGKVYSYEDTNSVKAIVKWAKDNGYTNIMVYDFPVGLEKSITPHDNLLKVLARETRSGSVTPPPVPLDTAGTWLRIYLSGYNAKICPVCPVIDTASIRAQGIKQGEGEFILDPPSYHKQ